MDLPRYTKSHKKYMPEHGIRTHKHKIDKKMICCDQCNILTTDFIRSCDGYDIFLENLCKNCAVCVLTT